MAKITSNQAAVTAPNTEVELIGTLLTYPDYFQESLDCGLTKADFSDKKLQVIFEEMREINSNGSFPTLARLVDSLMAKGKIKEAGQEEFIMKVMNSRTTSIDIAGVVKSLKAYTCKRSIVVHANEITSLINKGTDNKEVLQSLTNVSDDANNFYNGGTYGTENQGNMLDFIESGKLRNELQAYRASKTITGFEHLDRALGDGMYAGTYVVAAASSLGKTTFVHQIADSVAASGKPVLYFSLEMSQTDLIVKSISRGIARKPHHNLKLSNSNIRKYWNYEHDENNTALSELQNQACDEALEEYRTKIAPNMNIVSSNFKGDLTSILSNVNRSCRTCSEKPLVVIDYIQVIQKPEGYKGSDQEWLQHCMNELEHMAKDNNIVIIIISSINRMSYAEEISFQSLKGSGAIEFSADCVIGLDLCAVEELQDTKDEGEKKRLLQAERGALPRRIRAHILKNRGGRGEAFSYFRYYADRDYFQNTEKAPKKPEETSTTFSVN